MEISKLKINLMGKFTDRYIALPIKVFDAENKNLTGKETLEDTYIKILPFEISSYKPTDDTNDEFGEFKNTYVTLKNGYGFYVYLHIDEFEKILNNHGTSI